MAVVLFGIGLNSAFAEKGCQATDAALFTAVGAGAGAAAATAAVWTFGILAAPLTFGASLATAAVTTLPAIALGAKGGAVYGLSTEGITCGGSLIAKVLNED